MNAQGDGLEETSILGDSAMLMIAATAAMVIEQSGELANHAPSMHYSVRRFYDRYGRIHRPDLSKQVDMAKRIN